MQPKNLLARYKLRVGARRRVLLARHLEVPLATVHSSKGLCTTLLQMSFTTLKYNTLDVLTYHRLGSLFFPCVSGFCGGQCYQSSHLSISSVHHLGYQIAALYCSGGQ